MRRGPVMLACIVAVVLAAGPAAAKEIGANLDPPPVGLDAGDTWSPIVFVVTPEHGLQTGGEPPTLTVRNAAGETTTYRSTATTDPGFYELRVVFPDPGRYRYWVTDPTTGERYDFPVATIGGAAVPTSVTAPAETAPAVDDGAFPSAWEIGACLAGAGVALGLLVVWLRRSRHGRRSPLSSA